jgi:hypothetical protein
MFRPSSSAEGRDTEVTVSGVGSFETLEVVDTSGDAFPVKDVSTVLAWMQTDAPPDVMPRILSFCGSRKVNALSRLNKTWNKIITTNDLVWRVMCEDTHKVRSSVAKPVCLSQTHPSSKHCFCPLQWKEGDEIPSSWLRHYKQNPSLPFDYDSINAAFDAISAGPTKVSMEHGKTLTYRDQRKSARILLQPGPYFLSRSLVCNIIGAAHITFECMVGNDPKHGIDWSRNYNKSTETTRSKISRTSSILDVSMPSSAHLNGVFSSGCSSPMTQYNFDKSSMSDLMEGIMNGDYPLSCIDGDNPTAFLIYEAQDDDEPCIRIRKGAATIRGLKFLHYANGTDIWNGNAAIQVQGPFHKHQPLPIVRPSIPPTAHVIDCDIQSLSGRGMVSIDGGITRVDGCNIHNCAATGLYLGGIGSVATVTRTDVYENGNGNERARQQGRTNVSRGHSGIYVEQGIARVRDCNISKNSLTGMSGIHQEKATLQIENSDIISNGSVQLELPPRGSVSRDRSFSRGNNISAFPGQGRPRTRFLLELLKPSQEYSGPIGGTWVRADTSN